MAEIIYKIAGRGEGKTKWLVHKAKYELDNDNNVVLLTTDADGRKYKKFVDNYFSEFRQICRVGIVTDLHSLESDSVVLIDNLFELDLHMNAMSYIADVAKRVYITAEGKVKTSCSPQYYEEEEYDHALEEYIL